MTSIYGRTDDLFSVDGDGSGGYVVQMRLERCGPWIRVSGTGLQHREAQLMRFALRRVVADFAIAQRRSKAKLAEVVALEGRR